MSLVLEVEHLVGVAFAARDQVGTTPDWPPQPARVFSALVAAWSSRGEQPAERAALEWLEAQPLPEIAASGGGARSAATVFVPPNDPETKKVGDRSVLPALRRRQPRRFPAFRPHDPVARLVWRDAEPDAATLTALNALAGDTSYVGHSASLTRCRFRPDPPPDATAAARWGVYPGRLAELERAFHAGDRPGPGESVAPPLPVEAMPPHGAFAARWLVLPHVGGDMPDLLAAAIVAKALRQTIMAGYGRSGHGDAIPTAVSGHNADKSPTAEPHLAVVPLAFLGSAFADGHVVGFAIVPPEPGDLLDDLHFQAAVRAVAPWNAENGRREMVVCGAGFKVTLALSGAEDLRSLDPAPYVAPARVWATATPIVLDRHLKARGNAARDREVRDLVADACRHAGLPEPMRLRLSDGAETDEPAVRIGKHSAVKEAPPAWPSSGGPAWTAWKLPPSLAGRQLTHAVLQFAEPVRGPILLGAGRFHGLGLCRALDAPGG